MIIAISRNKGKQEQAVGPIVSFKFSSLVISMEATAAVFDWWTGEATSKLQKNANVKKPVTISCISKYTNDIFEAETLW